jgi:hypothetical protein
MVFGDGTPVAAVKGAIPVVAMNPIIIHLENILLYRLAVQIKSISSLLYRRSLKNLENPLIQRESLWV